MKHAEHILALEINELSKILPLEEGIVNADESNASVFLSGQILPALDIKQRRALDDITPDKVHTHRQILPYITITRPVGDEGEQEIFVYQRGKGVGESRLEGNKSIGVGGHIDVTDVISNSGVVDIYSTIFVSMQRELLEEIVIVDGSTGQELEDQAGLVNELLLKMIFVAFINDNSDFVGRDHLGLSTTIMIDADQDVRMREPELQAVGWRRRGDSSSIDGFENWSKLLLTHFE